MSDSRLSQRRTAAEITADRKRPRQQVPPSSTPNPSGNMLQGAGRDNPKPRANEGRLGSTGPGVPTGRILRGK